MGAALVDPDLVDTINLVIRKKPDDEKRAIFKEKIKQYPTPENCDKLKVPRVDHLLWDQLETQTRSRDASLQQVQQT